MIEPPSPLESWFLNQLVLFQMGSRIDRLKTLPVIAICGATGTGKSKLAIDIAKRINGEVINADAVQLYKGLDIATNKVRKQVQYLTIKNIYKFCSSTQIKTITVASIYIY